MTDSTMTGCDHNDNVDVRRTMSLPRRLSLLSPLFLKSYHENLNASKRDEGQGACEVFTLVRDWIRRVDLVELTTA